MNCKCVIFDMGGVCVTHVQIGGAIARRYGIDPQALQEDYQGYDRPIMDGLIEPKTYWQHVAEKFHVDPDADPICEMFHPQVNQPVIDLIKALKERGGMRLLLGSNTCRYHWQVIDALVPLSRLLDHCYLSCDLHLSKPDPEFYLTIARLEGLKPQECLFIDDLAPNIEGARAAGLQTFHFQDTPLWPADTALRDLLGLPL